MTAAVIPIAEERAHAKLSASGSKKWLTCTPSANLEEQFPDESSAFAAEGTFMHELFELKVNRYLQRVTDDFFLKALDVLRLNAYWSQDLEDHVDDAVAAAKQAIDDARAICKDPVILVEQRLDFSLWVEEGFGTGDLVLVTDDYVWVLDLKGGKGVLVDAVDNSQMRLYGLGAYNALSHLYDIKRVRMTVLQPRKGNYSSEEMTADELLRWGDDYVKPRATLAWDGLGEFAPGEHCSSGFCRARFTCAARAQANLAVAKSDFALQPPELLTMEQMTSVLERADEAIKWLSDVQTYALQQAEQGHAIAGWKLVEGRANRKYGNADEVAKRLVDGGVPEAVIYERALLGITAMEKALGKKVFGELVGDLLVKPAGKPTLVPAADKRPALSSAASAAEDFS